MHGRPGVALSMLMIAAGLSACAPVPEPIETLTVTESEYRAAFAEFLDCMDAEGFGVIINDDSGTVIDYAIPEDVQALFAAVAEHRLVGEADTSSATLAKAILHAVPVD